MIRTGTGSDLVALSARPANHAAAPVRRHGLRFLALTDEKGRLIWISAARATTTSWPTCAPPVSGRWPTSASAA